MTLVVNAADGVVQAAVDLQAQYGYESFSPGE
jgi:hypothetical protein